MLKLTKRTFISGLAVAMMIAGLTATQASAAPMTVAVTGATAGAGTVASPYTIGVPADNSVDAADVLTVTATVDSGTVTTMTAAGDVFLTQTTGGKAKAGVSTLTVTPAGTTVVAYVHTTSTNAGSVTVTAGGTTLTFHLKGIAGTAYNIALAAPANGNISTTVSVSAKVTDVFGNPVASETPTVSAIGATAGTASASDANGVSKFNLTFPATVGSLALSVALNPAPQDVAGLAAATKTANAFVPVVDNAATIAALNAKVAELTAALESKTAEAAAANAKVTELTAKVDTLTKRVNNLVKSVKALRARLKK